MAELADAHGSGPCERKFLQVQVLLSAPVDFFVENLDFYKSFFPVIFWYSVKFSSYKLEYKY